MKYDALISTIADTHQHAQAGAAVSINRHLILRNWLIGAYLIEFEQCGEDRAQYGSGLLQRISSDLKERHIPGTSADVLERMRQFYSFYPQLSAEISATLSRKSLPYLSLHSKNISAIPSRKSSEQTPSPLPSKTLLLLSWSKFVEFIHIDDPWKRAFYENQCLKENWSVRQLQRQIGSMLYERTGLSSDKEAVIEHARKQAAESPSEIVDIIRDPYVIEFTGLAVGTRYKEKDLETALIDHLQSFLLELGTGFCFEARQKRITVSGEHDYIDLVFYHRILRCHLLIDLKIRAFKHADAGQMNFYLNFWKDQMM